MKNTILAVLLSFLLVSPALAESNFVSKVIDGQTLKLISGEEVKLIGISVEDAKDEKAAEFVRQLVSGSLVELEYDVQKQDANGDLLAYVWFEYQFTEENLDDFSFPENYEVRFLEDESGFGSFYVLLNATVVKSGLAMPNADTTNTKHALLFDELYQERMLKAAGTLARSNESVVSVTK